MDRDPQKDLELCRRATPAPWATEVVEQTVTFGLDEKRVAHRAAGPPHYAPRAKTKAAKDEQRLAREAAEADRDLVTVAREALEYWIRRAQAAEAAAQRLVNELPDCAIDEARSVWGNTNAECVKLCRDELKRILERS